jgi:hypothetical protein
VGPTDTRERAMRDAIASLFRAGTTTLLIRLPAVSVVDHASTCSQLRQSARIPVQCGVLRHLKGLSRTCLNTVHRVQRSPKRAARDRGRSPDDV